MDTLQDVLALIAKHKVFAFDLEAESTTGDPSDAKNPRLARITHVALAAKGASICLGATDETRDVLVNLLKNSAYVAVVHYWPYDGQALHYNKWIRFDEIACQQIDTLVLSWLLDEENDHGLKPLVLQHFKHKMVTYKEVSQTSQTQQTIAMLKEDKAVLNSNIENWEKARPYPSYTDAPVKRSAIKKLIKQDLDAMNPDVKKKVIAQKTEEELANLFSDDQKNEYAAFVKNKLLDLELKKQKHEMLAEIEMREYARDDAKWLLRLYGKLMRMVAHRVNMKWISVEMAVHKAAIQMEIDGINIDTEALEKLKQKVEPLVNEFQANIYNLAKMEFNPDSPQQVSHVIFNVLGVLPPKYQFVNKSWWPKLTPAGQKYVIDNMINLDLDRPETLTPEIIEKYLASDKDVLERLDHPIGQAILDYRTVRKLYDTYIVGIGEKLEQAGDGKLHTRFNTTGTDTGRFSSAGPNLQNIPSRAKDNNYDERIRKLGSQLRKLFVAPPPDELAPEGYDLIIADQSQIELRLLAHFSRDTELLRVYNEGVQYEDMTFFIGDIHAKTTAALNVPRKLAKNVNFGFNYGMGAEKFARQVKLFIPGTFQYDIQKAQQYKDGFFKTYPRIPATMEALRTRWFLEDQREFPTISGRHRHFRDEKVAAGKILNAKIQGSGADLLKACIYVINRILKPRYPGFALLLQVHDELVARCPKRFSAEVAVLIKYIMEYPWFSVRVPLLASARVCACWADNNNEAIPEVGVFYAEVDGIPRVFNETNWAEWMHIQEDKTMKIGTKSACAHLTPQQKAFARTIVPDNGPIIRTEKLTRVITREEELAEKQTKEI